MAELQSKFSSTTYNLWYANLSLLSLEDDIALVLGESDYMCKIIAKGHKGPLEDAFEAVTGHAVEVKLTSDRNITGTRIPSFSETLKNPAPDTAETKVHTDNFVYHNEYTFDNFIVGGSNVFAHAACTAVAGGGAEYNPLFIYGQSGLGKTHLMYAVTNAIQKKNPNINLVYIKGEDFTNQLIQAIAEKKTPAFREKYRHADVLLIDDVQFIAGKESTQEEFFHTFNTLYEDHKQIILTSDRPPKEIKLLEDRLKTRFEWGLLADIQPPDTELRSAIIKKKSEAMGMKLQSDVVDYLSDKLRSNVRQIEGALKRLGAMSFLSGVPVTVELAARSLSDIVSDEVPMPVKVTRIIGAVCAKYGYEPEELKSKKRTKELAWARHVAIYVLRKKTDMSLPAIGSEFGRDHTTILSSYNVIEKEVATNPSFSAEINELLSQIDI